MARKSRKNVQYTEALPSQERKAKYSVALYARISVDSERKRESDTIGTQVQLLQDYVSERPEMQVYDVYADNNISGTDFIRPEFSRMMNDIRNGKVNCVIVKDLSRLGRNMLESGDYIEQVFPQLGIRFIAVTDRFDTLTDTPDISVQIRNYANELYARDISKKICSIKKNQQEAGKRTGATAPYGYMTDPEDKGHLLINPETAPIVLEIFRLFAEGNTMHAISKILNEQRVMSPGKYLYQNGLRKTKRFQTSLWYMNTIKSILTNPVYLGWIVSGRRYCQYYATGSKNMKESPEENWIIRKGMHEPIVSVALFEKVQKMMEDRKEEFGLVSVVDSAGRRANVFKGILRCGECGHAMTLRRKGTRGDYYICSVHDSYGKEHCPKKGVKSADLESAALTLIRNQINLFTNAKDLIQKLNREKSSDTRLSVLTSQLKSTMDKIEKLGSLKVSLYEDLANGVITKDDYRDLSNQYSSEMDELRIFASEIAKTKQQYEADFGDHMEWSRLIAEYGNAEKLDHEMAAAFLDSLAIYNDGHMEFQFKYRDELDFVLSTAALRGKEAEKYV